MLVFFKFDFFLRNFSLVVGIRSEETRDQILRNPSGGSTKEEVVKKEEEEEKEEKRGVGKKRVPKKEPETKKENKK